MKKIVGTLAERANFVLLDYPAGIETGFRNAAAAAKEAIVITTPEMAAVRDADRVIGLLHTQGVAPIQMVLNRVRPKMVANQEMLGVSDVTDILALPLLGLVLEDEQVITSTNRGEPLTLHGALSPAGRAYMNVARRLRGEEVALIDPTRERLGLRARLMGKIRRTTGLFLSGMALFDFLQHLLGLQKPSATTARERLQLVLAHDRSDLNPELLERMRREILEVVQKYVEIDIESGDVSLTTDDRVTALVANLPIRRARPLSSFSQKTGARTNPSDPELLALVANPEMPEPSPSKSSEVIEVQDAAIEP